VPNIIINRRCVLSNFPFAFTSVNAENFWNNLIAENFDPAIYSKTAQEYKMAINSLFVNGIDPIISNLFYAYIFRGDSNDQKLLDASLNSRDGLVVVQPTIENAGYDFNGTTQYISSQINIDSIYPTDEKDFSLADVTPALTGFHCLYGSNDNTNRSSIHFEITGSAATYFAHGDGVIQDAEMGSGIPGVYYGIHNGISAKMYYNKIEITSQGIGGVQGSITEFVGCENHAGVPDNFFKGKMGCIFRGNGNITVNQANNLTDAWNTFKVETNG
jgi:hypothetical protein